MHGIFRRSSGTYFARLVVPERLRSIVGQREFVASTGVKEPAVARIVAGQMLTTWRQRLLELERLRVGADIDVLRIVEGSPQLALGGHLPLADAAAASGLPVDTLLRAAADGRLLLWCRVARVAGFTVPVEELEIDVLDDHGRTALIAPTPDRMPSGAARLTYTGVLALPPSISREVASALLARSDARVVMLAMPGVGSAVFVPNDALTMDRSSVHLAAHDVQRERQRAASLTTPQQIEGAKARQLKAVSLTKAEAKRPLRESIQPFLDDHDTPRKAEQVGRIRGACELFLELAGPDLCGADLSRDLLRRFRDDLLPKVPANENRVRLMHRTKSVSESIKVLAGDPWPRLSPAQQTKRLIWLGGWLKWLSQNEWAEHDLSSVVVSGGAARREVATERKAKKAQDRRDTFSDDDLQKIFSASWWRTGRGELTEAGTYREWSPYRYWLPLMALLSGARPNELAQLRLDDLSCNPSGIWLMRIDGVVGPAAGEAKSVKNSNSLRQVPVHSELIRLGLVRWRDQLAKEGRYDRLFPELKYSAHDQSYANAVTKWFSPYLKSVGVHQSQTKVFYSFRHTVLDKLHNSGCAPPAVISQIVGHERGPSEGERTYRKDVENFKSDSPICRAIESLDFPFLKGVAPFDVEAGAKALSDAMRRKR